MKGAYRVIIQNKRIRYDFEIKRNITVIRGDSATGKTTLIEMVQEYYRNGNSSAIELVCEKKCVTILSPAWKYELSAISDSIVFIDEDAEYIFTNEFATTIKNSDNYYVIVTRAPIPSLPYSVDEIYGIKNSGKYGTLKRTYNHLYHIYNKEDFDIQAKTEINIILTEDSNAGYEFFDAVCQKNGNMKCISADGKSNIHLAVRNNIDNKILVIADGAAFGPEMEAVEKIARYNTNILLYLPESFEWLILKSGLIQGKELKEILNNPENYIESETYFSWERFFNSLLQRLTQDSYLQYNKKHLNTNYLSDKSMDKMLNVMRLGIEI